MKASCAQSAAASGSFVIRSAMLYTRPPYRSTKVEKASVSPARHRWTASWSVRVTTRLPRSPEPSPAGVPPGPLGGFAYSGLSDGHDLAPPRVLSHARPPRHRPHRPPPPHDHSPHP